MESFFNQIKKNCYHVSEYWKPYETKDSIKKCKRIITYYLPQFHRISENDLFWGNGFTEWRNVSRSLPIYDGHYQPRCPADLGYYDLSNPEVINQQALLAKNYGIFGWAIYHYQFGLNNIMTKPLDIIYSNPNIDINYCLFWANENWTKAWDGKDANILIKQNHCYESDIKFISYASKFFFDPRYIRMKDNPVLIIYRPDLFPNILKTIETWKNWCSKNNIPQPYFIKSEAFNKTPAELIGMDASAEFPPHYSRRCELEKLRVLHNQTIFDPNRKFLSISYESFVEAYTSDTIMNDQYKIFKCVFPAWDNSSRRITTQATIIQDSNPKLYEKWLTYCLDKSEKDDLIFVNAWNEWAEGAYLEPDLYFGHAYLDATWQALKQCQSA